MFKSFQTSFQGYCPVTHKFCRVHYERCNERYLRNNLKIYHLTQSSHPEYNPQFAEIYRVINRLYLVPPFYIPLIIEHISRSNVVKECQAQSWIDYLQKKLTAGYCASLSWTNVLISSELLFVDMTTNRIEARVLKLSFVLGIPDNAFFLNNASNRCYYSKPHLANHCKIIHY